ncbi:MAG: hypothetical protein NZ529_09025, partial [Cytophagaceae bacterium]|nr:hypothetical protein [Cytophagaceae bacterium]MDW8456926.1 hypothetical protein [Cytophagaceae bacterium]
VIHSAHYESSYAHESSMETTLSCILREGLKRKSFLLCRHARWGKKIEAESPTRRSAGMEEVRRDTP